MALDGLLRTRAAVVQGIVNGIDDTVWNPATDAALAQNYSALRIDMRVRNKTALQTRMGLTAGVNRPLFGVVSRLSDQKGLDLLLPALPGLVAKGGQLALLGSGDPALEAGFTAAAAARPDSVGCVFGYDEKLAHLFQAGADFIVVPSRFEPCGLTQLCALRYGAMPIVARVGGLADTVIDANEAATAAGVATGVQFYPPSVEALVLCARPGARDLPRPGDDRAASSSTACASDVSWRGPAQRYAALYRALAKARRMSELRRASASSSAAQGLEAALVLPNAESASLCLYDGDREVFRAPMARDAHGVLRGLAPGFGAGARYGFRVDGPYDPARGARFDASKLLADPYAWRFDRPFRLHPSMFAFGDDSGPFAPKAIAGAPPGGRAGAQAHRAGGAHHLRAQPARLLPPQPGDPRERSAGPSPDSPTRRRSTHLAALGVTAVEIMPADAFVDERHLPPLGLSNAWGYNAVVFGAPDPRLAPGGWAEVRAATDALHAAGMEAILDVVFNHNGESDQFGPTLSFRGLDNAAWFRLDPRDPAALRQRHRHRQLPRARPPAGHRHGDRRAEALDDPRRLRRLPLRSRDRARPPRRRLRSERAVLRGARRRSGPGQGAPDRRAVGRRPGRLPARPVRPRVRRMERPLPRRRAPLLARRRRAARRDRDPDRGLARHVPARGGAVRRASTSSSPTTVSRSPISSPTRTSTTRPTARTIATARTTTSAGTMASRVRPTIRRSSAARSRDERNLLDAAARLARNADAVDGHGARLQPGRQQQRLRPGQRDERDRLARRRRFAHRLHRPADQGPSRQSRAVARRLPDRCAVRRERPCRRRMARRRRADDARPAGTIRRARFWLRSSPRRKATATIASRWR